MSNIKNTKSKSSRSGFTIIELIVTIVVIAILASITLVSYSYLQKRAADTATVSNIKQYVDALDSYAFEHGNYPAGDGICLGAEPSDSYGGCGKYDYVGSGCEDLGFEDGSSAIEATWDQQFNDSLRKYMGEPNKVQTSPYRTHAGSISGCDVYLSADAPTYTSAEQATIYTNGVGYYKKGESGRSYYINYSLNKDGECRLNNSIKQTYSRLGDEFISCIAYGGDAVPGD